MGARGAILVLIVVIAGCPGEEPEPFRVIHAQPEQGEFAGPLTRVELGFSHPVDRGTCHEGTLHLGAVDEESHGIAWFADYLVEEAEGRNRVELVHDGLVVGVDYLLAVQTGPRGCLSGSGLEVEPFAVTFPVVSAGGD